MKKLLFALAGFMFLAFASCGDDNNANSIIPSRGSKEYEMNKKIYKAYKAQLEKAKECKDLDAAIENALRESDLKFEDLFKEFEGKDTMTAKEKEEIKKMNEDIDKLLKEQKEKLCK